MRRTRLARLLRMPRLTARSGTARRWRVAAVAALVSVPGLAVVAGDAAAVAALTGLEETFDYPGAARILGERGVRLLRGDGGIVSTDCTGAADQARVYSRRLGHLCFAVRTDTGHVTLELPEAYLVRGSQRALTAQISVDGTTSTVQVPRNTWVGVGEGTDPEVGPATLLELRAAEARPAGGPPAGPLPAAVQIDVGDARRCSGALVAPSWVLTAASCFVENGTPVTAGSPPLPTTAVIGRSSQLRADGHARPLVELAPHPDRNVLLARLAAPVSDVVPVPVASSPPRPGDVLQVAGYGRTATEWVPDGPRVAPFVVDAVHADTLAITGSAPASPATCPGDGGGPALRPVGAGVELVAIHHTSGRRGCLAEPDAETTPGSTETRVDDIGPWIAATARAVTAPVSDLDGDGRSDLVHLRDGGDQSTVWAAAARADGSGLGPPRRVEASPLTPAARVATGDLDGDGRSDLVALRPMAGGRAQVTVLPSTGNALDAPRTLWESPAPDWDVNAVQLSAADLTGDGRADVVVARPVADGWQVVVLSATGAGPGEFALAPPAVWHSQPAAGSAWPRVLVRTADATGDGRADLVRVQDNGSGQVKVLVHPSTGGGLAAPAVWFDSGLDTWSFDHLSVVAGDVRGAGRADLAVLRDTGRGQATVTVLVSDGARYTAQTWWTSGGPYTFDRARARLVTGDVGGDGRADLAILSDQGYGQTAISVLGSTGTAFAEPAPAWASGEGGLEWSSVRVEGGQAATRHTGAAFRASSSAPESWGWSTRFLGDGHRDSTVTNGWASWSDREVDHTEWVELTFPGQRWFDRVDLYPRRDGRYDGVNFPANIGIDVWDGAAWIAVVKERAVPNPVRNMASFSFPLQWTNSIRVRGESLRDMQLAEIEVLQTAPTLPPANALRGGRVTASSSAPESWGWSPRWLTDGTRGGPGWSSWSDVNADHTETVEIALAAPRLVNRVDLYPRADAPHTGANFPRNFTIEVWNGTAWEAVVTRTGYPALTTGEAQRFGFPTRRTSRIRVVATGVKVLQFSEAEAYLDL